MDKYRDLESGGVVEAEQWFDFRTGLACVVPQGGRLVGDCPRCGGEDWRHGLVMDESLGYPGAMVCPGDWLVWGEGAKDFDIGVWPDKLFQARFEAVEKAVLQDPVIVALDSRGGRWLPKIYRCNGCTSSVAAKQTCWCGWTAPDNEGRFAHEVKQEDERATARDALRRIVDVAGGGVAMVAGMQMELVGCLAKEALRAFGEEA